MTSLFDLPFEEPPGDSRTEPPRPVRRIYTVTELTCAIRATLEEKWFEVWVEGEISNCRPWNGHLYFTLKDDRCQLRGFVFKSDLRRLRFKPADGLQVVARGRLTVYEQRGEYQLVCAHLEPRGVGALQLAFEQLKRKLQAEGLFDPARKRPLPVLPRRIGLVTSIDGAALRDVLKVLRRRYANLRVLVRHARVQGEGAGGEIAAAIRQVSAAEGVDVIIVSRGGGSIEDLWAFNEEVVARAIARCPVPVVTGVGHEMDFTIADFVADVRAATPSNAAEVVVARKDEFVARIARLGDRVRAAASELLRERRRRIERLVSRPALAGFGTHVAMRGRHVAEVRHALTQAMRTRLLACTRRVEGLRLRLEARDQRRRLAVTTGRLSALDARLIAATTRWRHRSERRFHDLAARLESLSPLAVLARGYAVCWNADRTAVIRDATPALVGRQVHVRVARGELLCGVEGATPLPPPITGGESE